MVALVGTLLDGVFLGKNIAVLGAAFKPDSDDVRDSPALHVAAAMHVKGASVRIHDPQAIVNAEKMLPTLTYCASIEDACRDADVTILATEWTEYQSMDPSGLAAVVRQPVMVDGRNVLDRRHWANSGWAMYALGRGSIRQAEDLEILDAHDAVLDGARQ
jgi:UDPglucose 6-dehydrogenase